MSKPNFKKVALMGMASGMLLASQTLAAHSGSGTTVAAGSCGSKCGGSNRSTNTRDYTGPTSHGCGGASSNSTGCGGHNRNGGNTRNYTADEPTVISTTKKAMTESELRAQLNAETKTVFDNLSPEGKALALKLANQDCKGRNDCKGLGACNTSDHSCAGKNGCRGTSPAPFKDKNIAVKVAAKRMEEKRGAAASSTRY
ncbi:MAG: hypothetical protein H0X51_00995 [Parachlamydiaceae bacterium]|nr:hypothetical protein [Parachlamydiaceae bacterium]